MTNHDLTIWMVFGSASFIAFMVTLWLLLKANWRAHNNRLGEMHWQEQVSEANRRILHWQNEANSWEGACHNAEDKIAAMEADHKSEMNRRIIKIIHLNVPPKHEKTTAG